MEVVIVPSPEEGGELVAGMFETLLAARPDAVVGLATGSSPLPAYRAIIGLHRAGRISFAGARAFLLDEYLGLPAEHPQSYRSFIRAEFTDHVDFPDGAVLAPFVDRPDPMEGCAAYDRAIAEAGGVSLQLLGIGTDGHIGFNEPVSSLASRTRIKTLTSRTREDNARFFDSVDEVPTHVLTQGIGTILEAGHLVLMAFGAGKADIVAEAVEGPITASVPASALQLHPHVTVVVDEAAAGCLRFADYYRETFDAKPAWQGF